MSRPSRAPLQATQGYSASQEDDDVEAEAEPQSISSASRATADKQQPQPWQPWKLHGVKLQKHSGLDGKSVVSVGSQVPILMAIDGH